MANSSSEDETDTLPERPTRIQPYQFESARQDFERLPVFHGVCEIALTEVLATLRVDCVGARALLYLGSSANCYISRQHSRPA